VGGERGEEGNKQGRKYAVTAVIVIAAVVAIGLLAAIMRRGRSRFADESERFKHVSDLTSQWSREKQAGSWPADPGERRPGSIDLRDDAEEHADHR
jgi:hypothetical protein